MYIKLSTYCKLLIITSHIKRTYLIFKVYKQYFKILPKSLVSVLHWKNSNRDK